MILNENAQPYLIGEKMYCVGDLVYANQHSEYEGLFGRIIEIRDGEDKLTESADPEFVCAFAKPVLPDVIHHLERRISRRDRQPKMVHEIDLSREVLSAEAVTVIENENPVSFDVGCFRLNVEWIINGSKKTCSSLFSDYLIARKRFMEMLETEINSGCIDAWSKRDEFFVSCDKEWFECWLVGECDTNHYKIALVKEELHLTDDALKCIGRVFLKEQYRTDFLTRISKWDVSEKIPDEVCISFYGDPDIPVKIHDLLKTNIAYQNAYNDVIDEVGQDMFAKYGYWFHQPECYSPLYDTLQPSCGGIGQRQCETCKLHVNKQGGVGNE